MGNSCCAARETNMAETLAEREGPISEMSKLAPDANRAPEVAIEEKKVETLKTEED